MHTQCRFIVHTAKCAIATIVFIFMIILSFCMLTIQEYIGAVVFFAIGLLFVPVIYVYGATVTIDDVGIRTSRFGRIYIEFKWSDVSEVGIAGTNLFSRRKKKRTGSLYFYISDLSMTDDERFDMMLRFPPSDKIYLVYSGEAFTAIQLQWNGIIQTYNTDNTRFHDGKYY